MHNKSYLCLHKSQNNLQFGTEGVYHMERILVALPFFMGGSKSGAPLTIRVDIGDLSSSQAY